MVVVAMGLVVVVAVVVKVVFVVVVVVVGWLRCRVGRGNARPGGIGRGCAIENTRRFERAYPYFVALRGTFVVGRRLGQHSRVSLVVVVACVRFLV